ncbi:MAG TPA: OmpH family outer membrane protein [Geomobilimonas sp.]|nr:OmpH family outer membrane protein [Geomobilimonas sp.]
MKKIIILAVVATLVGPFAINATAAEPAASDGQKTPPATTPATDAKPTAPADVTVTTPAPPATPAKTIRIGYVDMVKAASDSAQGKAAFAEMKAKTDKYKRQIEAKQKQLEKQKAAIEAKIETMTPQVRTAKAKEFQKKVEDFQRYVQNAEKEMRTKEENLSGKLFKAIEKAAADYGKANGYAAVVVKKELLYMGENVDAKDLTEEIVKGIDATPAEK